MFGVLSFLFVGLVSSETHQTFGTLNAVLFHSLSCVCFYVLIYSLLFVCAFPSHSQGTQPIDDRAGVCSRLDYCWQQAVERCGCETSLNSMALLRIGYLFIIAAIVALALSPDTLGFFLFALFSTMAVTLCMRAYVMAARRRRYTTLTERDVMRLHASGLLRMNRVNPTHLRLAMMEGDFSPNDYDNLLRLDEELRESQFNGIPQSQIQRLPTQIVTETSAYVFFFILLHLIAPSCCLVPVVSVCGFDFASLSFTSKYSNSPSSLLLANVETEWSNVPSVWMSPSPARRCVLSPVCTNSTPRVLTSGCVPTTPAPYASSRSWICETTTWFFDLSMYSVPPFSLFFQLSYFCDFF